VVTRRVGEIIERVTRPERSDASGAAHEILNVLDGLGFEHRS
jgi:hypothetical protein